MTAIPAQPVSVAQRPRPNAARRRVSEGRLRRLLLAGAVAALPLQDHIPAVAGFSVMYLAFAVLGLVAVFAHWRRLFRAAAHYVFIVAYGMLAITLAVEVLHSNPSLFIWSRMAQMVMGGVIIASYCRSPRDVRAALTGWLVSGIWVGIVILKGAYGAVASAGAAGFAEASILRHAALGGIGLHANWNALAFVLAGAAVIAAARAIVSATTGRLVYGAAALFCVFGTFLTFSRSGVVALLGGLVYVFVALLNRKLFWRLVLAGAAIALVVALAVPDIVFQRFRIPTGYGSKGLTDSRLFIYSVLIEALPEYAITGVGAANYWERFAFEHGLFLDLDATGAHNTLLQVWVYWGILGLLTWLLLFYVAWHALRRATAGEVWWVGLTAFALVMLGWAFTSHDVSDKTFSIVLGLIVGLHELRRRGLRQARR